MKKEVKIPNAVGFCKHCYRERRTNSAYCGQCQNEPDRMPVYWDEQRNFPLLNEVIKKFEITPQELKNIIFTYGDTFFSEKELSYGLIAHEITHTFQQLKTGVEKWWKQYIEDDKFRLSQEVEAYQQQYRAYKRNSDNEEERLDMIALDLSGAMYGKIITFDEAKKLIRK